ncbi:unnamed protein product [Euphydryas editha]|uniref:Uncharacterized protein n=1 Tax=Euphydryas editha TaxID=104508 RepID=A0AAU9V841_EUPED|nr:unnamed protein product [Euphydryas editha]
MLYRREFALMELMSAIFFAPPTPTTPTIPPQENQMNISVQSPNRNVMLRFPVLDLRRNKISLVATQHLLPIISLILKPREPNENLFESLQDEMEFDPNADNPMTTYMM